MLSEVLKTLSGRRYQAMEQLKAFLRFPSVSAKSDHNAQTRACADWLAEQLRFAMLESSVMETRHPSGRAGHPVVVAKNRHQPGRPTVLVYGHYDVQPPEPLELWESPAFEPTIRKDASGHEAVFARGAVDDKGQVWCHVEAITAWQAHGGVPVNLTLLIEGEEEVGSESLASFMEAYKDELKADVCLISDTGLPDRNTPAITAGLRGLVYAEIILTGPDHDVHSGQYGGAIPNPANVLCQIIASMHDAQGRVTIPGFYDDVLHVSMEERNMLKTAEYDEAAFSRGVAIAFGSGEQGFNSAERVSIRPTLDVNGLTAGYQGEGAKTVIGSTARAKVSMRLVPDQDPHVIRASFERSVRARVPGNVKCEIKFFGEAWPVLTPVDSAAAKLAREAVERIWGRPPVFTRSGGTIPVVADIKRILGCDTLLVGFGLPDDRVHSPNEKFDVEMFHRGTDTAAALYEALGRLKSV